MPQTKILVVESDAAVIKKLRRCLINLGYHLLAVVSSGPEAMQQVAAIHPDVILWGTRPGEADRWSIGEQIRLSFDVPIIYLMANLDHDTLKQVKPIQPFDYILKPINQRELHLVIEATLYRYAVEKKLNKDEQRFHHIVSCISAHIYVTEVTAAGRYLNLYLSPHVEPLTGYPIEKFMADWNFWPSTVIHPDDRENAARQAYQLAQGGSRETEYRIIRADGQILWVRDSGRTERQGTSTIIYGLISDITESKRLEEQLRQSQKLEAVGRLAGGIAHDFNNLLTVIIGDCDLLLMSNNLLADSVRSDIDEIKQTAHTAAALTRQLLAFSRRQILEPKVVDLNTIVTETHKMLCRLIGKDVKMELALGSNLGHVRVDPYQMGQVMMNLVVNARDAMPKGGRLTISTASQKLDEASTRYSLGLKPGHYVTLTVSDTGVGMDAETELHLFEPFFTTKEAGKGTGLGLATVHGIVRQSGGQISVSSAPGRGTSFTIYLPQVEVLAETAPLENQTQVETLCGSETLLLVEDEINVRTVLQKYLSRSGYTVLEARHGKEALSIHQHHPGPIHLLITNLVMMGMNGHELAQYIIQSRPETKVLFISGYADEVLNLNRPPEPRVSFLPKPFTPETLGQKVRIILNPS
jgi:hypothetical protein